MDREERLSRMQFEQIRRLILETAGIELPPVKQLMLESRLRRRLKALGMKQLRDYCDYVLTDAGRRVELIHLLDAVTTNKTDFFRESDHFDFISRHVLPAWKDSPGAPAAPLRCWSAGCSSGQEPYTLAMVLSEHAAASPGFAFEITATDLSSRMLENARRAVYPLEEVAVIPERLRRKYLRVSKDRQRGLVRVNPRLRSRVSFRRLNLIDADYGLPHDFDLILCRNVLIYFDRPTQQTLVTRLLAQLKPGGYLFTGHSEALHGFSLPVVSPCPAVYRKEGP